jgi:hypothetical protein
VDTFRERRYFSCSSIFFSRNHHDAAQASRSEIVVSFTQCRTQEKTGPLRARLCSFAGAKPTITFQRGTADCTTITAWEEQRPVADSDVTMGCFVHANNADVGMSAMRHPHVHSKHQQYE